MDNMAVRATLMTIAVPGPSIAGECFCQSPPLRIFRLDFGFELGRRVSDCIRTFRCHPSLEVRRIDASSQLLLEPGDDLRQ